MLIEHRPQPIRRRPRFCPRDLTTDRQQRRRDPECKPANQSVAKGLGVLLPRKTQHHDGHDEGVVGAQQALEGDESADGYEVSKLYVQDGLAVVPKLNPNPKRSPRSRQTPGLASQP